MQCPFCQEEVGSEDDLQLHCLVCSSAYAEPEGSTRAPTVDSVVVSFRWVKSRPCFEREVHLISSLAGSVKLHWKEDEGLYESGTVGVPVGPHTCQLAIGGDVIPTEEFEVNEDSDVIFIILQEANYGYMFDENDRRTRTNAGDVSSDGETDPVHVHDRPPLDMESRENRTETANEMSALYRELLQHQLSHGEPSWVPGSGVLSPVMSDVDLSVLAGQRDDDDPPILTPRPDSTEERLLSSPVLLHPGLEAETRPGDLSGESDGLQSPPGGGDLADQCENEAEDVLSSSRPPAPPSSASPVPSSHSEHYSRASSRDSPANSVPSEAGARDDSVISPLLDEALRHDSPPPITGTPLTEEEQRNVVPPYTFPQATPVGDHASPEETDQVPPTSQTATEEQPREHAHSSFRASPLGSVLDAVTVTVADTNVAYSTPAASPSVHEITSSTQRHSPAGSVHSSSLFSSGLPSPIMSPRVRSQSDTGVPVASRGSPLGSIHIQTQPPLRPQSLGGSVGLLGVVPISVELLTTGNSASHLESRRGPISGAEGSSISSVLRQSPTGSNHSTSAHPRGRLGQAADASHHLSQRSTPVLSAHSEPPAEASPFVEPPRTSHMSHRESGDSTPTPSVHSAGHRTLGAGSPTELSMETVHRQVTDTAAVVTPVMSPTGSRETSHLSHRESGDSTATPSVHSAGHRTSGAGSPTELSMETVHRQDTDTAAVVTPVMSPTGSRESERESENSTPSVHSPRHRISGAGNPSELLAERAYRQGTPPVVSRSGFAAAAPPVMPSRSSTVGHGESDGSTPSVNRPWHRTLGTGSPSEPLAESYRRGSPTVPVHSVPSRASREQGPASSIRSRAEHSSRRVLSPPLLHESVIPSRGSAFAAVNGEHGTSALKLLSDLEALRKERDTMANDFRQRAAHYEAELRRVKSRNEDLEQQMLSIETVASLAKQDDEKTRELEQNVVDLNRILREKDEEIHSLQESMRTLERTNQQLKDEQESLKTVNQLSLEEMNKLNSDLQLEIRGLQRRSRESKSAEGKMIELQVLNNTLEQQVRQLQRDNDSLERKLKQAKQELNTMKTITSRNGSRIGRAKSETDLSKKFDKYTSYDRHKYTDMEPTARSVSFATRNDSLGLGTTRYSSLDTNYTRSHDAAVSSPVIMNGYGSPRSEALRQLTSYTSLQDKLASTSHRSRATVPRHRVSSLGDDSDVSDDVEHGMGHHTATQPRWRAQSSESSTSSVISWDPDYRADAATRQPRASAYSQDSSLHQQVNRLSWRRPRPHSYHGATGSLNDVFGSKDEYTSYHTKSSPYSHSLRDVGHHSTASSRYSTSSHSHTTSPYAVTASRTDTKLFSKPFAPKSSSDIQVGMEVLVTRSRGEIGRGVVKYIGPIPGRKDTYIGVELGPGHEGKHDGSLNGLQLFSCKPNQGIFVSFSKVVMCYG